MWPLSVQQADSPSKLPDLRCVRRLGAFDKGGDQTAGHVTALKIFWTEALGLQEMHKDRRVIALALIGSS